MSFSEYTSRIRKHMGRITKPLRPIAALLKFFFFLGLGIYILIELTTPNLSFRGEDGYQYASAEDPKWQTLISAKGSVYSSYHAEIMSANGYKIPLDVFLPQHLPQGLPLTIISANFIRTERLLDWIQPRGNNAIVVYHPPRLEQLLAPNFPFWSQILNIRSFSSFWAVITTNPISKWYSTYRALHEAPYDISEIVRWSQDTLGIDSNHINMIGMGSGCLTMTAAADRLQNGMGIFPHTLTLIYPPADLQTAIRESLFYVPTWLRAPASYAVTFAYRRLELERHLSRVVSNSNKRLLVIPINAWELSTLATLPAVQSAGEGVDVERINVNYSLFYDIRNIEMIHAKVINWLQEERAIGNF